MKKKSVPPETASLRGKRIAITRNRDRNSALTRMLRDCGAEVLDLPLIRIVPEENAVAREEVFLEFGSYEWLVFTSRNGVEHFFKQFFERFEDIRALGLTRLAAIGAATAEALRRLHLKVDVVPEKASAESLADALTAYGSMDNLRVLVVTGNRNRKTLANKLEAARAIVDTLQVYRTEKSDLRDDATAQSFRKEGADAILFASASAVQSFVDQAGVLQLEPSAHRPLGCSIGPLTSETMRATGIPVDVESPEASLRSLVTAVAQRLANDR